jgi:hypothetical protein
MVTHLLQVVELVDKAHLVAMDQMDEFLKIMMHQYREVEDLTDINLLD